MTLPGDLTEAGVILKTHGYKGHLRVSVYLDISFIQIYEPVFLLIAGKPVPFFTEELRVINDEEVILKLEDINDDLSGRQYEKTPILIPRSRFPEGSEPEHNLPVLTGYTLHDLESGQSFIIKAIHDTGAQILLEVHIPGKSTSLVPYHEDLTESIDEKNKVLVMRLPEGIF